MGCYINPPDCTKEEFLRKHGTEIGKTEFLSSSFNPDILYVCLVDNFMFTAAGICDSASELSYWQKNLNDGRNYRFYRCPKPVLEPYLY